MPSAPIESATALWEFFVRSGNIRAKDYDAGLVDALRLSLGIPIGTESFESDLLTHRITTERLTAGLFSVIEPFGLMMTDLCEFFERRGIKGTNKGLRIRFEFDNNGPELTFDLRHFREYLEVWDEFRAIVDVHSWDISSLWRIHRILPSVESSGLSRLPMRARNWIETNSYPGRESAIAHWLGIPMPGPLGVDEIDSWVMRVHETLVAIARACAPYDNYANLDSVRALTPGLNQRGAPSPVSTWGVQDLAQLESDYFTGSVEAELWSWVTHLGSMEPNNMVEAARPIIEKLSELFGGLPTTNVDDEVRRARLEAILKLPVWSARAALYQAWMLTAVEKIMRAYPSTIHDDHGDLVFRFGETHLASFETCEKAVKLIAERRSPLERPQGKGRTANIQPDYILASSEENAPDRVIVVIETKQYLRPKLRNFIDALVDYARGHPQATVILADYGPVPAILVDKVPDELRTRTVALGDVRPRSTEALKRLAELVLGALPLAPSAEERPADTRAAEFVVVDISGSMRDALADSSVVETLRAIARENPQARWLAVDDDVRLERAGPSGLERLLELPRNAGTDLAAVLRGRAMSVAVVITDEEGIRQLAVLRERPRVIGCVKGAVVEWR